MRGDCLFLCLGIALFGSQEASSFIRALVGLWLSVEKNVLIAARIASQDLIICEAIAGSSFEDIITPLMKTAIEKNKLNENEDWRTYCFKFALDPTFAADTLAIGAVCALFEVNVVVYAIQGMVTNTLVHQVCSFPPNKSGRAEINMLLETLQTAIRVRRMHLSTIEMASSRVHFQLVQGKNTAEKVALHPAFVVKWNKRRTINYLNVEKIIAEKFESIYMSDASLEIVAPPTPVTVIDLEENTNLANDDENLANDDENLENENMDENIATSEPPDVVEESEEEDNEETPSPQVDDVEAKDRVEDPDFELETHNKRKPKRRSSQQQKRAKKTAVNTVRASRMSRSKARMKLDASCEPNNAIPRQRKRQSPRPSTSMRTLLKGVSSSFISGQYVFSFARTLVFFSSSAVMSETALNVSSSGERIVFGGS